MCIHIYMCEQVCTHVLYMHKFVHLQHCVHLCELMLCVLFENMYMHVLYAYVYVSLCMKCTPGTTGVSGEAFESIWITGSQAPGRCSDIHQSFPQSSA